MNEAQTKWNVTGTLKAQLTGEYQEFPTLQENLLVAILMYRSETKVYGGRKIKDKGEGGDR